MLLPGLLGGEVSGRVLLEDSRPARVEVELRCGEKTARVEADEQGRFSFDLAGGRDCEVTAFAAGYMSQSLAVQRLPLRPEIPGLVLHRTGKWQGDTLSVTSVSAPDVATRAFAAAIEASDLAGAAALLEEAVSSYPSYAEAWFELGRAHLARSDFYGAKEALASAIAADPWFVPPFEPLLLLESASQSWEEVRRLARLLLHINPNLPGANYHLGLASFRLGDTESAERATERIENGPDAVRFAGLYHLRGLLLAARGERQAAQSAFRRYLELEPAGTGSEEAERELGL